MANDVTFALKLTADSKELVAQLTLSRDSLAQLGQAARNVGADAVAAGKSIVDGLSTGAAAVDQVSVKLPALSDSLSTTGAAGAGAGNQIDVGMSAGAAAAAGAIPKIQQVGATLDDTRQAAARSAAQFDYVFGRAIPQAQAVSNEIAGAALSTRQLAFALRGVPAQFTDIATSLIAGQPPMMVLLQQGGQLKDMFGGIGPAARALGGYVAGLVNPFTVAAASAAGLALAYYQGSEEADGYRNALILTGNAAGTTAGQLQAAAQSVSATSGVTQAAAAEIVTALAQTGKIGANNLGVIADAAARMERAVGDTVAESVKQFSELGAAPVAASIKLNETTNYLTESVYHQIKALEEQGRTAEAGALAQTAWADAMGSRADEILGNLGTIERSWLGLKDAAKGAWDAMLDVGRKATLQDQLEVTGQRIDALRTRLQKMDAAGGAGGSLLADGMRARLAAAEREEKILKARIAGESHVAAMKATENAHAAAAIALSKESEKYLDKETQKRRELLKLTEQYLKSSRSPETERDYLAAVAGVTNKFSERPKAVRKGAREIETAAKRAAAEEEAALNKLMGMSKDYQQELRAIQRLRDDGRISAEEHSTAVQKLYLTESEGGKAAAKVLQEENKRNAEAVRDMVKEYDDLEKSLQATTHAANDYIAGLQYANQERAIEIQALFMAEPARAVFIQQKREELALAREIAKLGADDATASRMRGALAASQLNEGVLLAARRATQEWGKFTDDVERSLTDSLMRAGEAGGRGAGDIIVSSINNTLKTAAFKIPVQAVVEPVMSAGRSVLASTPGAGNLLGITSNASSIYSAYNGAGGYAAQAGAWLDGIIGTTGSVSQGAMLMAQTAAFEGSQSAMLLAQTEVFGEVGAALTAEAAGVGAGMAEGFMAAIPGWGWAGMAALALFGDDLFGSKGGPKTEGTYTEFGADYQVRNGALNQTAADFARSAEAAYDAVARIYGLADASLRSYAEISADPAGDAMTQLGLILERAGQIVYDRSAEHGGTENVGRSDADLKAAMADAVSEAVLYAVARADGMPAAVEALFDTFESGIADLSVERSSALAAALTGGWLDDLLTTLDESALGLSGVADAAAGMLQKLPVLAQQTGLTADAIGQAFNQALTESAGATEAGQMFAELAADSVYSAMQGQYAQSITNVVMAEIVNPMLLALATGGNVAELLASGIVSDAVERAQQLASAYSSLMSSPEFTAAMNALQGVLSSVGSTAWVPDYNAQASRAATAAADAAESAARAAEDAARAMLAAQTSLVDAQISLIQGLQSAAADWRALSTGLDQDMLRLSRLDPAFDGAGHYTDQITGLLGDWHSLVTAGRDPDSLSYQQEQVALAEQIHRAAMDRYDAELEALERNVAATREMAQSSLDLRRYVEGLRTGDLSPLTMGQKLAEAASNYQSTLARAQGGDMDARAQLSSVSDAYLKLSQGYYAGASADYSEIFRAVTSAIEGLAQPQRSTEDLLADIRTADATYNTAALDIARRAQSDLAVIKSVTDLRLSEVNASVVALGGSLRGYLSTRPDVAATTTIPDTVYTSMGQTAPVAATVSNPDGRPAYNAINMSHEQMRDLIAQSGIADGQTLYREIVRNRLDPYTVGAAYGLDRSGMDQWLADQQVVRVPGFAVGTNRLPADTLAMVHQDERIMPAADNRELFRRLSAPEENAAALVAEIRDLRAEVALLREDNQRHASMLAGAVVGSSQDNATQVSGAVERAAETRRSRAGSAIL